MDPDPEPFSGSYLFVVARMTHNIYERTKTYRVYHHCSATERKVRRYAHIL